MQVHRSPPSRTCRSRSPNFLYHLRLPDHQVVAAGAGTERHNLLTGFYRRRILRVFPAFYVYALVAVVLLLLGVITFPVRDLLYAATYTINYVANGPWHLGHLWPLAVEEQFYLLWPFTLFFLGGCCALWAASIALLLAPVMRVAQFYLLPSHRAGISEEFHSIVSRQDVCWPELAIGYGRGIPIVNF